MRLSNRSKADLYNFLNTFLLTILLGGIAGFLLERYKFDFLGWQAYLLLVVPVLLLIIFYIRGRQIFEYDSDGEVLNFKNKNVAPFLGKPINDEFPKYKLLKYEVINGLFFKKIHITISSKKGHPIVLKYDVSYLTSKELRDLKYSLTKVVKGNKEEKEYLH